MSGRLQFPVPLELVLALAMLACGTGGALVPVTPAGPPEVSLDKKADTDRDLVVYSQNVYVGTDVDAVLASPSDQLQTRLFTALGTFLATDWPERAKAMAAEIRRTSPDVIALNEITILDVRGLEPYFPDTHMAFLPVLQAALAARHLDYVVAGSIADTDANLNLGGSTLRLQDFDVVLVRRGLTISDARSGNYAARVPANLGPVGSFEVKRGWVTLTVSTGQRSVRFVTTHFEPRETALEVQAAQATELLGILNQGSDPVILAGDLNTDPNESAAASPYHQLLAAGFHDSWLERNGARTGNGFTCCQNTDLRNSASLLFKRIDHLMVRPERHGKSTTLHPLYFTIFGDELSERTVNGLWPSDHAGLVVTMRWSQVDAVRQN